MERCQKRLLKFVCSAVFHFVLKTLSLSCGAIKSLFRFLRVLHRAALWENNYGVLP